MQPQTPLTPLSVNQPPQSQGHEDYNFILNPAPPPARGIKLPGSSLPVRIALFGGGLLVLIIVFAILKSLLGGGSSNVASITSVMQEQQVLIHLTTNSLQQPGISTATSISSSTINASALSAQKELIAYAKRNHYKIPAKQLDLKISTAQDQQLTDAASAGDYDATYSTIVTAALAKYQTALKKAYADTKGVKGKALLKSDYDGAVLMTTQLTSQPAS